MKFPACDKCHNTRWTRRRVGEGWRWFVCTACVKGAVERRSVALEGRPDACTGTIRPGGG